MTSRISFIFALTVLGCMSCAPTQPSPVLDAGDSDRPTDTGLDRPTTDGDDSDTAEIGDDTADQDDALGEDVPFARNARVGFQYVGSNGASHFVDDVLITGASDAILIEEGFEGGELPEEWLRQIRSAFFTWEIHAGLSEAHNGRHSAKVTWYEDQDEWLITPALAGRGPYTLTFWNKGAMELVEEATLHVHYTCTDGLDWHELYVFPGVGEDGSYIWYPNTLQFNCL